MPNPIPRTVQLATRGSILALLQAKEAQHALANVDCIAEPHVLTTHGDADRQSSLAAGTTVGWFTSTIEAALLDGSVDLAVHSGKDLPSKMTQGLGIAAVLPRGLPHDVVVLRKGADWDMVQHTGTIGTGSPRRAAFLKHFAPLAHVVPIRGNVDTRLTLLEHGDIDAIILAAAGLSRMGYGNRIDIQLDVHACVPAACQGTIAIQAALGSPIWDIALKIDDPVTRRAWEAERATLSTVQAGCATSLGVYAVESTTEQMDVIASFASLDGTLKYASVSGPPSMACELGISLGEQLITLGISQ